MKTSKTPSAYKKTLAKAQKELPAWQQKVSRLIHSASIESISATLSASLFRSRPLIFASVITLLGGIIALVVASIFNYNVTSLTFLSRVFLLGFVIGLVYEYLRLLGKR